MNSDINMSLEDIIKKKREMRSKNSQNKGKSNVPLKKKLPVTDARLKIISKKRIQITDAREKLSELAKQKDARLKIEQMRLKRVTHGVIVKHASTAHIRADTAIKKAAHNEIIKTIKTQKSACKAQKTRVVCAFEIRHVLGPYKLEVEAQGKPRNMNLQTRNKFVRTIYNKERVFVDPSRQVVSQFHSNTRNLTRQFNSNRLIGGNFKYKHSKNADGMPRPKPIVRTVENDIEAIDDPMDEVYEQPRTLLNRKASLQLKIVARNNDMWDSRSVLTQRTTTVEKEKSPPRPPSILKKRPMAALRTEKPTEKSDKPVLEYRIIVSNLRNTVTAGDIEELFGDVGGMVESRLVRPGTAEVIYKTQEDAQRAVDLYHNRQLDGQPMNCLLVTPRSNSAIGRSTTKPALYSTNSNVEPDISTFHKVLFSNL
ncbi:unnamed protein product [Diatraea saccharalis]|uniref:RRM domain-containing protein n=1 Tax=Diatraea saccharalis TaxID=40085 RepID=A0A9N9QUV7_9NEOP|nr:unnamed protein product [Diatraea saccharalis]